MWSVKVSGLPAPKGNLRCFGRGGRHRLTEIDPDGTLEQWMDRVQAGAAAILTHKLNGSTLDGPISTQITFTLPLPATVKPEARQWPWRKHNGRNAPGGDLDKLARAALDAITRAELWGDDSQVVELFLRKCYPHTLAPDVLDNPGAIIRLWRTED